MGLHMCMGVHFMIYFKHSALWRATCLTVVLFITKPGGAAVLRVVPWPMTETVHERIETQQVYVEASRSFVQWAHQMKEQTPPQSDIAIQPVAWVQIDVVGEEEPEARFETIVKRARVEAAWAGANLIFLERKQSGSHGGIITARFVAYRVESQHQLVTEEMLASLVETPEPVLALASSRIEEAHWTTRASAGDAIDQKERQRLLHFLNDLHRGTGVHIELEDGSSVQGTFSGVDQDNRIWVHPQGVAGFLADRAFRPQDVQLVALVNKPL